MAMLQTRPAALSQFSFCTTLNSEKLVLRLELGSR